MRSHAVLLAALLAAAGFSPAVAAADAQPPAADAPTVNPNAPTPTRAQQLDTLFATLKGAKSDTEAQDAETSILKIWLDSGSNTVDLLMNWTLKAMQDKDYPLALDFLDRIIVMKPDYVEGWNKRATVYYLTDDYSKSISDIAHTLQLEPRHFGALSGLGAIMHELGEDKQAIDAYQKALDVDPYLDNVKKALDELKTQAAGKDI